MNSPWIRWPAPAREKNPFEGDLTPSRKIALMPAMRQILTLLPISLSLFLVACAGPEPPVTKLEKANVLPLALDDSYQFRKQQLAFASPEALPPNPSEAVDFEYQRLRWGAVDQNELNERYGNYFTFFWRTQKTTDVTVRLEYRQAALGNYVMAQERHYPEARGSHHTEFRVTGDDYLEMGRVTSWRALLIVDGRIVALTQSFIWK